MWLVPMENSPEKVGKFASAENFRSQKGILITFSLVGIILLGGGLADQINKYFFGNGEVDSKFSSIIYQYIIIYMILHYFFNFIIYSMRNIVDISRKTLTTFGLFLFVFITFDLIVPIVFSIFSIYKINEYCSCLLNEKDQMVRDFTLFVEWSHLYIGTFSEAMSVAYEKHYPKSELLDRSMENLFVPFWNLFCSTLTFVGSMVLSAIEKIVDLAEHLRTHSR